LHFKICSPAEKRRPYGRSLRPMLAVWVRAAARGARLVSQRAERLRGLLSGLRSRGACAL